MLSRIFPRQIDNSYRGHWLAIWILVAILLLKLTIAVNISGLNPWINNRLLAQSADGIPVDTYGAEAASVVMFLFASWGLGQLALGFLGAVALIRYRAMMPLVYLLLIIEQVGRKLISYLNPIIRPAAADGIPYSVLINWGFSAVLVIGLVLSLQDSRHLPKQHSQPV